MIIVCCAHNLLEPFNIIVNLRETAVVGQVGVLSTVRLSNPGCLESVSYDYFNVDVFFLSRDFLFNLLNSLSQSFSCIKVVFWKHPVTLFCAVTIFKA